MDKEFIISYLKARNYWWQTREVSPADKGIARHEYIEKIRAILFTSFYHGRKIEEF